MKKLNVNIVAGGGGPLSTGKSSLTGSQQAKLWDPVDPGFTMAEILLSLTIIGVVAAITLPSLTGNINERTWNTQRKALYARFSQAIALMPSLNGYGTLSTDASGSVTADTAAETFITDGLAKVLKINNICDSEHLPDCGIPDKITTLGGSIAFSSFPKTFVEYNSIFNGSYVWNDAGTNVVHTYSQANTKTAAFETVNGESIAVFYYPYCRPDGNTFEYTQPLVCANFVYDLNGSKGPNTMGKDIGFITALYPTDSVVVAPMPLPQKAGSAKGKDANGKCVAMDSESRLPNRDEAVSLFTNKALLNFNDNGTTNIWTGSVYSSTLRWDMNLLSGKRNKRNTANNDGSSPDVRCIRR